MENKKQEAIEKAWKKVCGFVPESDVNGFQNDIVVSYNDEDNFDAKIVGQGLYKIRPKSLSGIENNNGWISILPDGSNLPKEDGYVYIFDGLNAYIAFYDSDVFMFSSGINPDIEPTHYQPIVKPKQPIY